MSTGLWSNERQREIRKWLVRFGLQPWMQVIEPGCGVGYLTAMIAAKLNPAGAILAFDVDADRVSAAKDRVADYSNATVLCRDAVTFETPVLADMVVLADVVEHIHPLLRERLMIQVASWLKPDGLVFMHIPNPAYLEWLRENDPAELQSVDEPVHLDALVRDTQSAGLRLHFLQTYTIWVTSDYQALVFRPAASTRFE